MSKIIEYFSNFCEVPRGRVRSGVVPEGLAPMILRERKADSALLVVVPNLNEAGQTAAALTLWLRELEPKRGIEAVVLPDPSAKGRVNPDDEILRTRLAHETLLSAPPLLLATPQGLFSTVLPEGLSEAQGRVLSEGDIFPMEQLLAELVGLDYDDEAEVNLPGEFARRGGIVDLFSPAESEPVRIEFFGDRIESMRTFSVRDQRSTGRVNSVRIAGKPDPEAVDGRCFWDCLAQWNPRVVMVRPDDCASAFDRYGDLNRASVWDAFRRNISHIEFWEGISEAADDDPSDTASVLEAVRLLPSESGQNGICAARRLVAEQLRRFVKNGFTVILALTDRRHQSALENWRREYDLEDIPMETVLSTLPCGVALESVNVLILTEGEIFYTPHRRNVALDGLESAAAEPLPALLQPLPDHFAELDEGDYAVHLLHGVGRFLGVRLMEINGVVEEGMELEFDDEVKLFVPVSQSGMVSRYAGTGKNAPRLSKLSSKHWNKLKTDALHAMKQLASELLRLQAARGSVSGFAAPPDTPEQRAFEASFPYRETPDQLRAITETKHDMEHDRPMDRLICGDVGYGKTEVAIRAIFKTIQSGKQAAFLVPTTILAQQHYYTLCERFSEYPVVVEVLSRFRSASEQKAVLKRLASGGVDVVVGTHRLIQPDVVFPDLGLVVVDEEQRFGVEHKERFKRMRMAVDVLTLSATPIPRTLYMSMTGLRDLSTLTTPPERRLPVQTIVSKRDPDLITEAIRREAARGGQVFFLHNRVRTIGKVCEKLASMIPEATFAVAHGQMEEGELEAVMGRFIDGKVDVLVCTTIIESGVDIPNANTIIIDDAHRFGLSELYQLRGRVGRWTRQAYAYMLLPMADALTSDARKRMAAIRKYTQLGAGFRLAMRDLEIRGSGNLLGAEQSGHISNLGFDLYCKLLRETVARLKGETLPVLPEAEVILPVIRYAVGAPKGVLCAAIPRSYIESLKHRLDFYRQFALVTSEKRLEELAEELRDRFGALPEEVKNLILLTRIRLLTSMANFRAVREHNGYLLLERSHEHYYRDEWGRLPLFSGETPHEKLRKLIRLLKTFIPEK